MNIYVNLATSRYDRVYIYWLYGEMDAVADAIPPPINICPQGDYRQLASCVAVDIINIIQLI